MRWAVIRNAPAEPVPLLHRAPMDVPSNIWPPRSPPPASGYVAEVHALASFDARALPRYRWVIIDDLGAVDDRSGARSCAPSSTAAARCSPRSDRMPRALDRPAGARAMRCRRAPARAGRRSSVGQIDAQPSAARGICAAGSALDIGHLLLLAPQPGDRVLVGASNGAPLLLERHIGRGRVLLYTSDLDDDWNDLPVQPLFVGLHGADRRATWAAAASCPRPRPSGRASRWAASGGPAGQLIDPSGQDGAVPGRYQPRADCEVGSDRLLSDLYSRRGGTGGRESRSAGIRPGADVRRPAGALAQRARRAVAHRGAPAAAAAARPRRRQRRSARTLAPLLLALVLLVLAESLLGNTLSAAPPGAEAAARMSTGSAPSASRAAIWHGVRRAPAATRCGCAPRRCWRWPRCC